MLMVYPVSSAVESKEKQSMANAPVTVSVLEIAEAIANALRLHGASAIVVAPEQEKAAGELRF